MDYRQLIASMSPQLYRRLQQAVELGRWPDGRPLTPEQREHALQAIIAWGDSHLQASERVGYIDKGHKAGDRCEDPAEQSLTWKE